MYSNISIDLFIMKFSYHVSGYTGHPFIPFYISYSKRQKIDLAFALY